jgi:putative transposase
LSALALDDALLDSAAAIGANGLDAIHIASAEQLEGELAASSTNALGMAIQHRDSVARATLIHSDHGTQFTSWAFTERAKQSGLVPSTCSMGDCFDNAVMEAFWSRLRVELVNSQRWRTRLALANALFEYLEVFHNRQRHHSSLGMLSPQDQDGCGAP